MKRFISCLAVSTALVCSVRAQEPTGVSHVNLGLFDPVQIADSTDDVKGFQLGLFWDRTRDMTGLSIAGIGNVAGGCMTGIDFALGFNWTESGTGVMWSLGFNRAGGNFSGWMDAFGANICEGHFHGFQEACSNYANHLHGVQFGFVNTAHTASGLQVGLVNVVEDLTGFQVGVLNFIRNSPLPFFPIVNAHF